MGKDEIINKKDIIDKKSKIRKYISIIVIILGLLFLLFIIIGIFSNKEHEKTNPVNDSNYLTLESNSIIGTCSLTDPFSDGKVEYYSSQYNGSFGVGDDVYCELRITNYDISEISFDFSDNKNIELIDVKSKTDYWEIKNLNSHIFATSLDVESKLNDIVLIFRIINNKNIDNNYVINLNNIKFTSRFTKYLIKEKDIQLKISNYRLKVTDDKLESYKLISDGSYKLINQSECNLCYGVGIASQYFSYIDYEKGKMMISTSDYKGNWILYDMNKGILGEYGNNARLLFSDSNSYSYDNSKIKYIYVKSKDSDKFGIVDLEGNVIKDFNLEDAGFFTNRSSFYSYSGYSVENNMFVDKKNEKYGIIKFTSDDVIIDYIFDSIGLINNKYFKAKLNDKWYLYSFEKKDKKINTGYDEIIPIIDDVIVVRLGKNAYIQNYNGDNIIDKMIDIGDNYLFASYVSDKDSGKDFINIYISKDEYNYEILENYHYYFNSKELEKIK